MKEGTENACEEADILQLIFNYICYMHRYEKSWLIQYEINIFLPFLFCMQPFFDSLPRKKPVGVPMV